MFGHVCCLFNHSFGRIRIQFGCQVNLELVKHMLVETDLNSGSLFISRLLNLSACLLSSPSWNWCWSSLSLSCEIEAITLHIYI
jgi:hypothetical protein